MSLAVIPTEQCDEESQAEYIKMRFLTLFEMTWDSYMLKNNSTKLLDDYLNQMKISWPS